MSLVGVDVGGTFTDAVLVSEDGSTRIAKVRSTPHRIEDGFLDGMRLVLERAEVGASAVAYLAHGTTIATNAIGQRRLGRTALVTNRGFRDVLTIGTQMRRNVYDLWTPETEPIVPRDLCLTVPGRIDAAGNEVEPLDEDGVRALAGVLRDREVEAVAVMMLFSFLNPAHELAIERILHEEVPELAVSVSSRVVPEYREYVRASTTALNASLLPLLSRYLDGVTDLIGGAGVPVPLYLMQTNGGVAPSDRARELPIALAASGPAAGVIGGAELARLVGDQHALTFDMGGTTADIGLVVGGTPQVRFSGEAAGMPISLPQIDVLCIGAGGGSIAVVDDFGSLLVGPASAGADPGPAAYGRGGTDATVTDAHVVLGTLDVAGGLAGGVPLNRDYAVRAVSQRVGAPLALSAEQAAAAILRIATANMANALRVMSIGRGHDPRRFALVAIGGAGPMHACALADEVGIPRVIIPRYPGVAAAFGLLATDVRHDLRRSWLRLTADVDPAALDREFAQIEQDARALLASSAGASVGHQLTFELDMRYRGQAYNLTVPLAPRPITKDTMAQAVSAFEAQHRELYGYTPTITDTEIVTLRARALALVREINWADPGESPNGGAESTRRVWDGEWQTWRVVPRAALSIGDRIRARTVVDQEDATVVVPSGWRGFVAVAGTIVLEKSAC